MGKSNNNNDLLHGSIWKSILWFSVPLLVGNLFQQLYNTVDSYVVGNYVSSNALAAVGQSTPIINMLVGFFMGLATGAGVIIAQYYGAQREDRLKRAVHTSMALTGVLCIVFTIIGITLSRPILELIGSPAEILPLATLYLQIFFGGVSFALIYNMGAGVLRAIGDSKRPLYYLIAASITNIVLDFFFVLYLDMGVAGVAIATLSAQGLSSILVVHRLLTVNEAYRVTPREIKFDRVMLRKIISVGVPTALQQSIVSFSNVIVQSYINGFGAAAVAGYSTTVKIDGFLQLPIQSFSLAITTFVGQNVGAKQYSRVKKGIHTALFMACVITGVGAAAMFFNCDLLIGFFSKEKAVIDAGSTMVYAFAPAYIVLPFIHIISGALRGVGLSKVPMYSMVACFVFMRQIYLAIFTRLSDDLLIVFLGWPITWIVCALILIYYYKTKDWLPAN